MTADGVVTVIQARRRSSRLPDKVLLPLGDGTVLETMVARVRRSRFAGTVVVATTTDEVDDEIARVCADIRLDCVRGHPTDLLDRHCQVAIAFDARHVVKIPSDCPLIDPAIIDEVLGYYLQHRNDLDYASNLHPPSQPDGFDVEVFSREALEAAWREATQPHEREHTTPFIWDHPERFRLTNVGRSDGRDLSRSHRVVLDYPEDYAVIGWVFDALASRHPHFTVDDVVDCLDANPHIAELNAKYRGVNWYRDHLAALATISAADTRHPQEATT